MSYTGLTMITVTGRVTMLDQRPAEGFITFTPTLQPVNDNDASVIFPSPPSVVLDGSGEFSIALPATDDTDITPEDWHYEVSVVLSGLQRRFFPLELPSDTSPVDLFLAAPVDTFPGVYLTGIKGDRGVQGDEGDKGDKGDPGTNGTNGTNGVFTGSETLVAKGNVSGAINCDLSTASAFSMTLIGNTTITFINAIASKVNYASLRVTQGGAGSYTLTIVGAQGSFGVQPVLSATVGKVDKIACESWDSGAHWDVALTGQAIA